MSNIAQKINKTYFELMENHSEVVSFGLGVTDPKGVFGTTLDLENRFGQNRVFDIPTSENALTGVAVGLAVAGGRPILCHQRLDFALLSVDQIINSAAKWNFMFGNQFNVPLTIRFIIGRGWGQGPTHSQYFSSWFDHVPGLKVVHLSRPEIAKSVFKTAVMDNNPSLIFEHRWLHNQSSDVDLEFDINQGADFVYKGKAITIVANSYNTLMGQQACRFLKENNVDTELIDIVHLNDNAREMIRKSVSKTGRLLCLDCSHSPCSMSSEIISDVSQHCFQWLMAQPAMLSKPFYPEPTSFGLTKSYYFTVGDIVKKVCQVLNVDDLKIPEKFGQPEKHDIPGEWFTGPF